MTGALNLLRQGAVKLLNEYGIYAVTAMDPAPRKGWDGPVAAVSVSRVVCAPGGFRDYLGIRTDPESASVIYGFGHMAYCNIITDTGYAIPAMGPICAKEMNR